MTAALDMTAAEQAHVRAALRFLHARTGDWKELAKALRLNPGSLRKMIGGRAVTATVAFRVARFAGVSVDAVLAGEFPPAGACPYCGHVAIAEAR